MCYNITIKRKELITIEAILNSITDARVTRAGAIEAVPSSPALAAVSPIGANPDLSASLPAGANPDPSALTPSAATPDPSSPPAAVPSLPPARRGRYSRYSPERLKKRLSRLEFKAIDCLEEILADASAKAADRISAAKLSFDVAQRQSASEPASDGIVHVIFEGSPVEYAE